LLHNGKKLRFVHPAILLYFCFKVGFMDLLWIILGCILMVVAVIGCFLPVLPGPPLAWLALLLQQLRGSHPFTVRFLIIWAAVTAVVTFLDYWFPIYGAKKFGGTKAGMWGATIGMVIGIFFLPPFGLIIGPFVGAYVGELIAGKESRQALKAGFGTFIGFLGGIFMKLAVTIVMAYHLIASFF
jgi:uncharacterized protein YqgC (DUF456 family)